YRRGARALRPAETPAPSQPSRRRRARRLTARRARLHGRVHRDRGQLLRLLVPVGRSQPRACDAIDRAVRGGSDAALPERRHDAPAVALSERPAGPRRSDLGERAVQSLGEIGDEVVGVLDADRITDEVVLDPDFEALLARELVEAHDGGLLDET